MVQERLDLRSADESSAVENIVEGLDAQPVPGEERPLLPRVPDQEGEHPVQLVKAGLAIFFVEMEDHLSIRVGGKPVPLPCQALADLEVIVYLPVKDDPDGPVLIAHRLVTAGDVDDTQAAMGQGRVPVEVKALVVRAAMGEGTGHCPYNALINGSLTGWLDDTRDAAHSTRITKLDFI